MYSPDKQATAAVKIESDEEENLPRKFPRLASRNTSEDPLTESVNGCTSFVSRVSEIEKNSDSDRERIRVLEKSNSTQLEQIVSLEKRSNETVVENQDLRQLLKLQQDENQQLKKQLVDGLKSEADSRVELDVKLNSSLNANTTTLTTMFNKYCADSQSKIDVVNAKLIKVEQDLQQERNARLAREKEFAYKYNCHTHDTIIAGVGACADIAARHGHAWGHTHTAQIQGPNIRF